jgi:hypothetical protein
MMAAAIFLCALLILDGDRMSDGEGGNMANIGDLAKPVDSLVNRIFDSLHAVAAPIQVRRIARAKAYETREQAR